MTLTNIVTSTNIVTLTNTVTQILPAQQMSGITITVAIISALIALIAGVIALQQFLLGKEKFRLDLFEKRYAVFQAVDLFLYKAITTRDLTNEDFLEFNQNTQTISFIFDEEITSLVNTIRSKARDVRFIKNDLDKMPQGDARHAKFKEYEVFQMELYDASLIIEPKFERYRTFHNWKYGLIWPIKKKPFKLIVNDIRHDTKPSQK
jgi:hypothetical protein